MWKLNYKKIPPIELETWPDDATEPPDDATEPGDKPFVEDVLSEMSKDASVDEATTAKPKVAKAARRRQRAKRKEQQLLKAGVQKQDINPSVRNLGVKRRQQFRQQLNSRILSTLDSLAEQAETELKGRVQELESQLQANYGLPSKPAGATRASGSRQ